MINDFQKHIVRIEKAAKAWLQPDNLDLKEAIDQTVQEGLFSFEDIKFQIRTLKQNIDSGQITKWAKRAGLSDLSHSIGKKVLCLHAGNLPLVGFQDALGTILSGAHYFGKLSRKDPWLLSTFLEKLKETKLESGITYSTEISIFSNLEADKVLFAGSESSVDSVREATGQIRAIRPNGEWVIRKAKFSIAYIDSEEPNVIEDLVEAVFRYGGSGCRSVAVVVSPTRFSKLKCHFQDYVEAFWLKNPQHCKPKEILAYQFAYNKAIGREQAWMNDFLIQETEEFPELDFTLHWVEGDHQKVKELKEKYGTGVQSVYTTGQKIEGIETEFLSMAQRPNLWWKPDGVGVFKNQ